MKAWARELALGLLLSTAIPVGTAVAADPAEQILLDKANFWRLKDRPDLAMEALNKLLALNPNQPDALYQYGMLQVQQGRVPQAQQTLARLRMVAPSSPRVADLENAVRAGGVSTGDLNEARRLAQSGQFAQAAQKYQQTFRGAPPTTFGVEYYQTLAGTGTPQGYDEARNGLERLAQASPNDPKIRLALAQVLTYRENSRPEGIRALQRLSRDPIVGAQAAQAWRQSMMWLGGSARDRQLYDEYLAQYPQDTEVRQHMADMARRGGAAAGVPTVVAPRAPRPSSGRVAGIAETRTGEPPQPPASPARTRAEGMRNAAKNFEARGDTAQAMVQYQQAIATDPSDPWVRLDFARFLARQGETAQAGPIIDPVAAGNTPESWYASAIFDSEQNRTAEALAKIDRIPPAARTSDINAFRERLLVTGEIDRAKQLARAGNRAQARNMLIALYARPPATPEKARLVADALSDIGETDRALQIARDSLGRSGSASTGATLDYAGLLLRTGRDAEAAAYVTRVESSGRLNADDRRGLERLKAEIAANRADQLRLRGDLAGAYDQVSPMLAAYPNNPTLLMATGRIYAAAGENSQAMSFFDAGFRESPGDINVIRGAVGGAIQAGDLPRARGYLAEGMQLYPNNPRLYFLQAEIARAEGDTGIAMRALQTARILNSQQAGTASPLPGGPAPAAPGAAPAALPPNPFRSSQSTLPGTVPAMTQTAAAAPAKAADDPSAIELAAIPADSDDLAVPPHAAERPRRAAAPAVPVATGTEVAQVQTARVYANALSSSDLAPDIGNTDPASAAPGATQVAQLEPLPPPPVQGYQPPPFARRSVAPAPQDSLDVDIQRSMAAIQAENNPTVQGGLSFRARSGEEGLSRLTEVGVPVEGSFSPFYAGTVRLAATPTFLTAGTPSASSLRRFGSDPLILAGFGPAGVLPAAGNQSTGGVGLSAGYSYRNFSGEVGTTPLGFPVENIIGRLAFSWPGPATSQPGMVYSNQYSSRVPPRIPLAPTGAANPFQVTVEGTREPITDSVLSYAGTKDPLSGTTWGGVVRTGGDVIASYDDGQLGFYGGGGGGSIDGQNVASNSEFDAVVGGFIRPYRSGADAFKVGINLSYFSYDRNLRFFTLGQGGYFSPQNYFNFGIPLEYSGRSGRLTYLAAGSIGVQTFNENRSPYFPTNAGDQAAAEAGLGGGAFYGSRSVTGPSFGIRGQLEYQLNNGFSVGGLASVDNAENYTEGIAKVYLRKTFGVSAPTSGVLPSTRPGNL